MKRFKQNPLRDIGLIIVVAGLSIWIFKTCSGDERMASDLPTYKEFQQIKEDKTESGKSFWKIEHRPTAKISESGIPAEKYDSIIRELGLKEKEIQSMTIYSATIKDSLKLAKLERDDLNNKVWKWEKTLKSGSKIVREMSEKDSILKESTDLAVATIDRTEGSGKDRRFYTIFYPLDDNVKFNGSSVFRKENKEIRDIIELSVGTEFRKSFLTPDFENQTDLNLKILPDGKFAPTVKIGVIYDIKNGFRPFYGVRFDYNFLRLKTK